MKMKFIFIMLDRWQFGCDPNHRVLCAGNGIESGLAGIFSAIPSGGSFDIVEA